MTAGVIKQQRWKRLAGSAAILATGIGATLAYEELYPVQAEDLELHVPQYPWSHNGLLGALDHASYVACITHRW